MGLKKLPYSALNSFLNPLEDLKQQLLRLNISLIVLHEAPEKCLNKLISEHEITTVYRQNEWTTEEVKTYQSSLNTISKTVDFKSYYNQFLYPSRRSSF